MKVCLCINKSLTFLTSGVVEKQLVRGHDVDELHLQGKGAVQSSLRSAKLEKQCSSPKRPHGFFSSEFVRKN